MFPIQFLIAYSQQLDRKDLRTRLRFIWACSITRSYSSRQFLCALAPVYTSPLTQIPVQIKLTRIPVQIKLTWIPVQIKLTQIPVQIELTQIPIQIKLTLVNTYERGFIAIDDWCFELCHSSWILGHSELCFLSEDGSVSLWRPLLPATPPPLLLHDPTHSWHVQQLKVCWADARWGWSRCCFGGGHSSHLFVKRRLQFLNFFSHTLCVVWRRWAVRTL